MDQLEITKLRIKTRIGVYAWEQAILQDLLLDIYIPLESKTTYQDLLSQTIDYEKLCQMITSFLQNHSFNLIETVAEKVVELIKKEFHVQSLTVRVSKPHAIPAAENISITLSR